MTYSFQFVHGRNSYHCGQLSFDYFVNLCKTEFHALYPISSTVYYSMIVSSGVDFHQIVIVQKC